MNTTEQYVKAEMATIDRLYRAGVVPYSAAVACVAPWVRALELADRADRQLPAASPRSDAGKDNA